MAVDDWPLLRWRMREYTARPMGHRDRQEEPAAGRGHRRRGRRARAVDRRSDRGAPGSGAAWAQGAVVGPQRHQVGGRGAVVGGSADDGHPGRVRPALRPHRAGAAAGGAGTARSTTTRRCASWRCGRPPLSAWAPRPTSATTSGWARRRSSPRSPTWSPPASSKRVEVDGWTAPAYLRAGRRSFRAGTGGPALLCPFDPLIFFRPRVERLFGFHYRIEIYTPAPKREFGYYVWPFLLDGQLVGPGRPQGRTGRRRAERRRRVRRTRAGSRRVWPARWRASCGRWRRGWGWAT